MLSPNHSPIYYKYLLTLMKVREIIKGVILTWHVTYPGLCSYDLLCTPLRTKLRAVSNIAGYDFHMKILSILKSRMLYVCRDKMVQ